MALRLTLFVAMLLTMLLPGTALAQVAAAQVVPATPRIVAIGDMHGDFQTWTAILRAAGVTDARGRWRGGRTILVQTGDVVDRGPDSRRIIDQLMRLSREAPRRGGRVIALTGNHEAMIMTGDLRYVHPGEYAAFVTRRSPAIREAAFQRNRAAIEAAHRKRDPQMTPEAIRAAWLTATPLGMIEHQTAWSPAGRYGRWTISNPAVVTVGNTLFVHGGISSEYAGQPLDQINARVRAALQARTDDEDAIINDPLGPLWYRGLILRTEGDEEEEERRLGPATQSGGSRPGPEQELERALSTYGVQRVVVGHTPSRDGIALHYGGRLVQIDTGNSRAYKGRPSYLEIVGDRLIPHEVPRPPEQAR